MFFKIKYSEEEINCVLQDNLTFFRCQDRAVKCSGSQHSHTDPSSGSWLYTLNG